MERLLQKDRAQHFTNMNHVSSSIEEAMSVFVQLKNSLLLEQSSI